MVSVERFVGFEYLLVDLDYWLEVELEYSGDWEDFEACPVERFVDFGSLVLGSAEEPAGCLESVGLVEYPDCLAAVKTEAVQLLPAVVEIAGNSVERASWAVARCCLAA